MELNKCGYKWVVSTKYFFVLKKTQLKSISQILIQILNKEF